MHFVINEMRNILFTLFYPYYCLYKIAEILHSLFYSKYLSFGVYFTCQILSFDVYGLWFVRNIRQIQNSLFLVDESSSITLAAPAAILKVT